MRVFVPLAIVMYALCGVAYVRMRYATNEIALDEGDDSMLEGESLDSVLDASTDDADGSGEIEWDEFLNIMHDMTQGSFLDRVTGWGFF